MTNIHDKELSEFSEDAIRDFVSSERLAYQKIDFPFGISTNGPDRREMMDQIFYQDMTGKSLIDIGSYLGAFCIESIKRGASRVVGVELDVERIRQAKRIAELLNVSPEYLRIDIEEKGIQERFDLTLALNVLHHLQDPIGTLEYLSRITKERIVIEAASLGSHDSRKNSIRKIVSLFLSKFPIIFLSSVLNQRYLFTEQSLRRILEIYMKKFYSVTTIKSDFKDRYIIIGDKLKIDRTIMVSGTTSAGKSTFCKEVLDNKYPEVFGRIENNAIPLVSPQMIKSRTISDCFPQKNNDLVIYHYDIVFPQRNKLHSFNRDHCNDILECTNELDIVILAPSKDTLIQQITDHEISGRPDTKTKWHHALRDKYSKENWLYDLYSDWLFYCEGIAVATRRYHLFYEKGAKRELMPDISILEIKKIISALYKN